VTVAADDDGPVYTDEDGALVLMSEDELWALWEQRHGRLRPEGAIKHKGEWRHVQTTQAAEDVL
jgi:hypothetical protein